jgi:Cu/Ag efflux protein CusF
MMSRRLLPVLLIFLAAATSAHAQYGGGGGGRGGGHGGQGQPPGGSSGSPPTNATPPPPKAPKPMNQIQIVGVVQAVDPDNRRVTIAYDANDELNWPHGTRQFGVYKAEMLKTVTIGEKVRFKLDSEQISEIAPFGP